MALRHVTLLLALSTSTLGQRPFYAGARPIGYPQFQVNTSTATDGLGDKFAAGVSSTTTQRLPIEALGDIELVNRLRKLPVDKQPFWLINWQALEANRRNPQTHVQRPSHFGQPFHPSPSSQTVNSADSLSTTINTASIGSNTASIAPTVNAVPDSANTSPSSTISPSSASSSSSLPVPNTNFPSINSNPISPDGSGFTSPAIGPSNSSPGDRNPVLPRGNRNEDSASINPAYANDFGFESPANGFAYPLNNVGSPAIEISDSEPGNIHPVLPLDNRNEGSASIKPTKVYDFVNPANDFANPPYSFASPSIGTSNIAPGNANNNPKLNYPLGNKGPSANANKKGVTNVKGLSNSEPGIVNFGTSSTNFANANPANINLNSANRNKSAYPEFDNVHSLNHPDINDSSADFEYEVDDFPFNSNEDQHFGPYEDNGAIRTWLASTGAGVG